MPLCRHRSQEVELTAGPASRLKTIKSNIEIGRSFAVTGGSGTNVGDCKFPLPTPPCPQTYTQPSGGRVVMGGCEGGCECVSHMHAHTHTSYSCWKHRGQVSGKERQGWSTTGEGVGLELYYIASYGAFLNIIINTASMKHSSLEAPHNITSPPPSIFVGENYFYSQLCCDHSRHAGYLESLYSFLS